MELREIQISPHPQHEQGLCLAEANHCFEGANSQRPTTKEKI